MICAKCASSNVKRVNLDHPEYDGLNCLNCGFKGKIEKKECDCIIHRILREDE